MSLPPWNADHRQRELKYEYDGISGLLPIELC
jgi:hypothetical protein